MSSQSSAATEPAFRILVIVARPLDQPDLPGIADQWALLNGLATVKTPAYIHILRPPTIERLRTEVLNGYDIIHFDGHGAFALACPNCSSLNVPGSRKCGRCSASLDKEEPRGYLAVEQDDGTEEALAAEDLAEIFKNVPGSPTKLVILSACESAKGNDKSLSAALLNSGIPAVLAMKETVPVDVTIALSRAFYSALGSRMAIKDAFNNVALPALKKLPDHPKTGTKAKDIPILQGQGIEAKLVTSPTRGSLIMEQEKLFGAPHHDFVGKYIKDDPPRGRKGLLVQTIRALSGGEKLVVLTGQGGIGKTVLASETAKRLTWRYPGGIFWRSAAGDESFDLNKLLDAFANVLGYEFRTLPLDAKVDAALCYLSDLQTPSLIVVDNAESIKDQALWRFLEGLPQPSAALVTTRESPKREGKQINLVQMEPVEAYNLFIIEARRRSPRWGEKLSESDRDTLKEIARLLDGHPLGIKLAAGLLVSDSLDTILQKIRARPPGEEISKRFDFSYQTLSESQRELLYRLAAISSLVAEWAIKAVSTMKSSEEDKTMPLQQWQDDLSELVRKSFVDLLESKRVDESEKETTARRYHLHPLMRQYASLKAGEAIMQIHHSRTARLFLEFADQFRGNYDALDDEFDNISASLEWAYIAKEWRFIKWFAWALASYLELRGYWKECRCLLECALKATEKLDDAKGRGDLLGQLGRMAYLQGKLAESRSLCQECLKLKHDIQDKNGIAQTLNQLGILAKDAGDLAEAERFYQEGMKAAKEMGDKANVAAALLELGTLAYSQGDFSEARKRYQESLEIAQELEDKVNVGISLFQLGILAYETDDLEDAQSLFSKSLKIAKELGDKSGIATSLHELGLLAHLKGDFTYARCLCQKSFNIAQELGDKCGISNSLQLLGMLAQDTGDFAEARRLYLESLEIRKEIGNKWSIAISLSELALLEEKEGNFSKALQHIKMAEALFKELGSPMKSRARKIRKRLEKASAKI
ncbi:MAG: tetratricopeptide repeat protein [Methanotrichaceae archaeon]